MNGLISYERRIARKRILFGVQAVGQYVKQRVRSASRVHFDAINSMEMLRKTSRICQEFRSSTLANWCSINQIQGGYVLPKTVSYAQWSLEPYCIGTKLRTLRTQKRLTLSRLAAETGLSTALLSKLETDRMIPTLPTLATISRVYGVGMSYFFSEPSRHTLSITRKAHLQGKGRGADTTKMIPLNPASAHVRMTAQMVEFTPGAIASAMEALPDGSGLVYVLEGRLQLQAGGMQEVLEEGDCACLESEMALSWSALGKHRCRVLAVAPGAATKEL
jgi:transcriptional regulator with XRE-family HTH domain